MSFGNIKNDLLYELKKNINELKNVAWRLILYSELADYGVELPKESDELIQLKKLDLSNKGIDKLPTGIGHLTKLTELDLSGNQLTKLPKEIGKLTQLTHLDLSNNILTSLPKEIGHLTKLTELDLSGNQLTKLPKEIGNLAQLYSCLLDSNKIPNAYLISTKALQHPKKRSLDDLEEITDIMIKQQKRRLLENLPEA